MKEIVDKDFDRAEEERQNKQKSLNRFNSITQKQKPENQNQRHNARKEGLTPSNQKR